MMLLSTSLGSQRSEAALQNDARLKHLPCLKTMQRAHKAQGSFAEVRGTVGNKCAHAVPNLHHAHRRQIPDSCAETGPAHLEGPSQLALGWNLVARLQGPVLDQGTNVVDHLHCPMAIGRVDCTLRHIVQAPWANPGIGSTTRLTPPNTLPQKFTPPSFRQTIGRCV